MSDIATAKAELRARTKRVLAAMSAEERAEKSARIAARIINDREFKRARTVMAYASFGHEVETTAILKTAVSKKILLLPRLNLSSNTMQPVPISDLKKNLVRSKLGFYEPKARLPEFVGIIDLVLVPGLAFDSNMNRLGRGAGYYDRFFQDYNESVNCGLAFESQIVDCVPVEAHDFELDFIVTEDRVIETA